MNSASTKIFEIAAKLGISLEEIAFLIEKLERVGLDANAAGAALRKAMKDLIIKKDIEARRKIARAFWVSVHTGFGNYLNFSRSHFDYISYKAIKRLCKEGEQT